MHVCRMETRILSYDMSFKKETRKDVKSLRSSLGYLKQNREKETIGSMMSGSTLKLSLGLSFTKAFTRFVLDKVDKLK